MDSCHSRKWFILFGLLSRPSCLFLHAWSGTLEAGSFAENPCLCVERFFGCKIVWDQKIPRHRGIEIFETEEIGSRDFGENSGKPVITEGIDPPHSAESAKLSWPTFWFTIAFTRGYYSFIYGNLFGNNVTATYKHLRKLVQISCRPTWDVSEFA